MLEPSSWEATFFSTYYQSYHCSVAEIGVAATRMANCLDTVIYLIEENVSDETEQRAAIQTVANRSIDIAEMLFDAYVNYFITIEIKQREKFNGRAKNAARIITVTKMQQ